MAFMSTWLFRLQVGKCHLPNSRGKIIVNFARHHRGGWRRVPKAILNEDEAQNQAGYDYPFKSPHPPVEETTKKPTKSQMIDRLISEDEKQPICHAKDMIKARVKPKYPDIPQYEKLAKDDKLFTSTMTTLNSSKDRQKTNKILLEGKRLIKDAIEAGVPIGTIYFSKEELLTGLGLEKLEGLKLFKVLYKQLQIWSTATTCPGIMAVCKKPVNTNLSKNTGKHLPVTVICDKVQEPGNLGAILRCVAAAGCEKVITTTGCVDVWNPKVLRGGCGAHFRFPVYNVSWPYVKNYLPENFRVFIADNNILDGPDNKPSIGRNRKHAAATASDSAHYIIKKESGLLKYTEFEDETTLENYQTMPLRSEHYTDIDFTEREHVVLIIGGETEGISAEAFKLAHDNEGIKTFISLANNVQSLNVASAVAVLTFEMYRQFSAAKME